MLMMWEFALKYTFKKLSTWIFLGIVSVLMFIIIYFLMQPEGTAIEVDPLLAMTKGTVSFVPYMIFGLFFAAYISIKISNIFKDGESDGTTLLLVSKEYTRVNIIVGRFLAVLTHIVMFALITFFCFLIPTAIFSEGGISKADGALLASTFVGAIFVGIIISSISLIAVVVLGKTGSLVLSMIISTSLPIGSIVIQQITDVGETSVAYNALNKVVYGVDENGKVTSQRVLNDLSVTGSDQDPKLLKSKIVDNSYNTAGYFDIWEQMRTIFSIFHPTKSFNKHTYATRNVDAINKINSNLLPGNVKIKLSSTGVPIPNLPLKNYFGFVPSPIQGEPYEGFTNQYFNENVSSNDTNNEIEKMENFLSNIDDIYYDNVEGGFTDRNLYRVTQNTLPGSVYIDPNRIGNLYNYLKEKGTLPDKDSKAKYTLFKTGNRYSLFESEKVNSGADTFDGNNQINFLINDVNGNKLDTIPNGKNTFENQMSTHFVPGDNVSGFKYESLWQWYGKDNDEESKEGYLGRLRGVSKSTSLKIQHGENLKKWIAFKSSLNTTKATTQPAIARFYGIALAENSHTIAAGDDFIESISNDDFKADAFLTSSNAYIASIPGGTQAAITSFDSYTTPNINRYLSNEYLSSDDFVSTTGSIIFWIFISSMLLGGTFLVHKFRDFK